MKVRHLILVLIAGFAVSCASTSVREEYPDLDSLIEDASWQVIEILWEHYEDLDEAPDRTIAVYYFTDPDGISPLSDSLVDGLTAGIANAILYEDVNVKMLSRTTLDQIMAELVFQSSELADQDTQLSVGKQLGARIILTGTAVGEEGGTALSMQLIEVESAVVLGGMIKHLMNR